MLASHNLELAQPQIKYKLAQPKVQLTQQLEAQQQLTQVKQV